MSLEKLIAALPAEMDGVIIESAENRRYFTGFSSSAGVLLATKQGSVFLTDSRYIEAAHNQIDCCEVLELKYADEQVPALAKRFDCHCLAFETDRTTFARASKLKKILGDIRLYDGPIIDNTINLLRKQKTAWEVEQIKAAQKITDIAFQHISGFVKEGMTERDICIELDFFMLKNGAEALSFDTIVASGVNGSKPHAVPSNKKVESGDFITLDFGAVVNGYHSDMTRTFAIGEVSEKQKTVYETVRAAQAASLKSLQPGVTCKAADTAARDVINKAGFGEFFGHGTGHGVGIEIHEYPTLSPASADILQVGNVVTVEPGIYLPGEFGVRIENMALITADGYEDMTNSPKELIVVES
jgi:Xaa-Pro aminopeptidase